MRMTRVERKKFEWAKQKLGLNSLQAFFLSVALERFRELWVFEKTLGKKPDTPPKPIEPILENPNELKEVEV